MFITLVLFGALADPTPFNCDQLDWYSRRYCDRVDAALSQIEARAHGQPLPSRSVVRIPAHGSAEAKKAGFACMGGYAMRRLPNGWEQLRTASYEFVRCEDE